MHRKQGSNTINVYKFVRSGIDLMYEYFTIFIEYLMEPMLTFNILLFIFLVTLINHNSIHEHKSQAAEQLLYTK